MTTTNQGSYLTQQNKKCGILVGFRIFCVFTLPELLISLQERRHRRWP